MKTKNQKLKNYNQTLLQLLLDQNLISIGKDANDGLYEINYGLIIGIQPPGGAFSKGDYSEVLIGRYIMLQAEFDRQIKESIEQIKQIANSLKQIDENKK